MSELGVVVHTCNSSTQEAEAGGFQVWGHPLILKDDCITIQVQMRFKCRPIRNQKSLITAVWINCDKIVLNYVISDRNEK
jgi:hypothetical protein